MKLPRSRLAAYLDGALIGLLLLLFSPRLTGLSLHEWLGLALVLAVLGHLLLSWSWIAASTRTVIRGASPRARINYLLNWTLLILIVLEITSGLVISQVAVPGFGWATLDDRSWRSLHNLALNWTHLVLGLHVAMNWQPLLLAVRRYLVPAAKVGP